MNTVSVDEIAADPAGWLRRVEAGEPMRIVRDGRPLADVGSPTNATPDAGLRPFGLCKGSVRGAGRLRRPAAERRTQAVGRRMSLLLDTHIFLWYLAADTRLPAAWVPLIRSPGNRVFVSVAAVWEATVKSELGKLPLPDHPVPYLPDERRRHKFDSLGIDEDTVTALRGLPSMHRDPFDRIQVAQARQHNLTVATVDAQVRAYPVALLTP